MARALAIETSARTGSLAAVQDGRVLAEDHFPHGLKHAAEIIPRLDALCHGQGWLPRDVGEVYVSVGPGSFTGLRIGITLAKTLAFATGARLVAVPTVRVLARNAPPEARHLVLVLDAKRDQIYTARFDRTSSDAPWTEAEPAHLDSLPSVLARSPRPVHLLGEGIPNHQKFIPPDDPAVVVTREDLWRPRAVAVADEGARMAGAGEFIDPQQLLPIYIRKPEAEEKFGQVKTS